MLYVLKGFEAVLFGKKWASLTTTIIRKIERWNTNKPEQAFLRGTFPKAVFIQGDASDFNLIKHQREPVSSEMSLEVLCCSFPPRHCRPLSRTSGRCQGCPEGGSGVQRQPVGAPPSATFQPGYCGIDFHGSWQKLFSALEKEVAGADTPNTNSKLLHGFHSLRGLLP